MSSILRAYVIKSAAISYDLFSILPRSQNPPQPEYFQYAKIKLDNGDELELIPDVRAEHKITTAVFLIKSIKDVDLQVRLALLNACQQGVYQFIFLQLHSDNQNQYNPNSPLNKLLVELNISPENISFLFLNVMPGEHYKITEEKRSAMKKLITILEEKLLNPPLPTNNFQLPESFIIEDKLLKLIHPLVKPATMFTEKIVTLDQSRSKPVGTDGLVVKSNRYGIPYLENGEQIPNCLKCGASMRCLFQVNTADFLHQSAELYGIYTVFECTNFHAGWTENPKIFHYPEPSLQRWQDLNPLDLNSEEYQPSQELIPQRLCFTMPDLREGSPHIAIVNREIPTLMDDFHKLYPSRDTERVYENIRMALGMKSLQISDHFGGWNYPAQGHALALCKTCQRPQAFVVQLEYGDWWYALWACTEHPADTTLLFYR